MFKLSCVLLLNFSSFIVAAQTQKATNLQLSINDCRDNKLSYIYPYDTILIYKLPDDLLSMRLALSRYRHFPILVKNLQVGEYKLKYKNIFGQDLFDTIKLQFKDINSATICTNKLKNYRINTLANLQNNESVLLNFHSQGCFGGRAMRIVISKKSDKLIASLYKISQTFQIRNHKITFSNKTISLLKTVELTSNTIDDFVKFENELMFAKGTGCTTTDWYDLRSKDFSIKREDGTCMWNGFYYLQKSIFGEID